MKLIFICLFPFVLLPQQVVEEELDSAFFNARKGIYWALSNIAQNKSRINKELIADNKLFASVKLNREIDGVKIESRGYFNSTEVLIKLYRSDDYLEKEGYLKKEPPAEPEKKKKKKL